MYHPKSHDNKASNNRPGVQLNLAVMPVDMAARAATAAFLYFDKLEIEIPRVRLMNLQRVPTTIPDGKQKAPTSGDRKSNSVSSSELRTVTLSDAGFEKYNNPCEEIIRELDELHKKPAITLVSIGTARPERVHTRKRVILSVVRRAVEGNGDPEKVHQTIENQGDSRIDYLRLNSPGGLDVEMDDWRPKKTGETTLEEIHRVFSVWEGSGTVREDIARCADKLVQLRRQRASGDEDRWKRFALGQYYVCLGNDCEGYDHKFRTRADFEAHVARHVRSEAEIKAEVRAGTRTWEYRPFQGRRPASTRQASPV